MQKNKFANNEQGMALIAVLLVLVVLTLLGMTIMGLAASNVKMTSGERNYQSTYYIAEAGLTAKLNEITSKVGLIYETTGEAGFFDAIEEFVGITIYDELFDRSFGHQPEAIVEISDTANTITPFSKGYTITSTGKIDNKSRTVQASLTINWKPRSSIKLPPDTVLFTVSELEMQLSNTQIQLDGNIVANGPIKATGNHRPPTEKLIENANLGADIPNFPVFTIPLSAENWTADTLLLEEDKAFNRIIVSQDQTLTIDVGNRNRSILVDTLELGTNGKINIVGSGKLAIYAKNIQMASGTVINVGGDINQLYLYLEGHGNELNNGMIYGSIFAKNANLILGNSRGIQGHVINLEGGIDFSSDSNVAKLIFAPNAEIFAKYSITGTIIGRTFKTTGNDHQIVFKAANIDYEHSPFFIDDGVFDPTNLELMTVGPIREVSDW
ncbi:PilX N-terminal domain-containing pilus assembly protein [Bacillus sp. B15-48]|uniref:PilX N-terminal domain-containing pilus assembly protein n=1 Tax=Bacillus sp. B15-48 TaxID=1548601 RepID=UPI00193F61CF|nr:PilX N-terminal domain-containing pilus assembly protein [Bacillus sp. B15-48]